MSNDWVKFIIPEHSKPSKLYNNIKTQKIDNPTRVITSGCSTAVESLLIFAKKELYKLAEKFFLQADGTTQCPHMPLSYSDITMAVYGEKAMDHPFKHFIWKSFRDDVIALWIHSNEDANHY